MYDLGCSTGNIGRVLAPTLHEREARLVALDECRDMVAAYRGPGRAITADVARYPYKAFDVGIAFLTLMFLPVPERRRLLATLRGKVKPGGAIIVVDKEESPGGYPATVLSRLTWDCKLRQGAGAGGGDAERAFAVRRAAAPLSWRVGARRRGGVPVRGFCGVAD